MATFQILAFDGGWPSEVVGSHLLLATGRRPNTDDLGLEKAGIETNARGFIPVDDQLRTNHLACSVVTA